MRDWAADRNQSAVWCLSHPSTTITWLYVDILSFIKVSHIDENWFTIELATHILCHILSWFKVLDKFKYWPDHGVGPVCLSWMSSMNVLNHLNSIQQCSTQLTQCEGGAAIKVVLPKGRHYCQLNSRFKTENLFVICSLAWQIIKIFLMNHVNFN